MAKHQIFSKSIISAIFIVILGGYIAFRGHKEKNDFYKTQGVILDIGQENLSDHVGNGKSRYLIIDSYSGVFSIFIGKDPGDFSPTYENIDQLKEGDSIVVYYDEASNQNSEYNNLIQYIDKENIPFFVKGNKDKYGGYLIISLGLLIAILVFVLKRKGKIE